MTQMQPNANKKQSQTLQIRRARTLKSHQQISANTNKYRQILTNTNKYQRICQQMPANTSKYQQIRPKRCVPLPTAMSAAPPLHLRNLAGGLKPNCRFRNFGMDHWRLESKINQNIIKLQKELTTFGWPERNPFFWE